MQESSGLKAEAEARPPEVLEHLMRSRIIDSAQTAIIGEPKWRWDDRALDLHSMILAAQTNDRRVVREFRRYSSAAWFNIVLVYVPDITNLEWRQLNERWVAKVMFKEIMGEG